ncbi:CotO family spore coat protein [Bacillus sp. 179-C3.3 HS]|uniref:CotO family spore coat protein n=1 Tax=Bacillus sp. 179-C3.3 HS TaxID=3232162 RepID=UPI0039A068C5
MANKGDETQKPLMYIVQPTYDESKPAMQNIVRKRKKSEEPIAIKQDRKEAIANRVQEPVSQEIEQKIEERQVRQQEIEDIQIQNETPLREPENTQKPRLAREPENTQKPRPAREPENTQEPKPAREPENTQEPKPVREPENTQEPTPVKEPENTKEQAPVQEDQKNRQEQASRQEQEKQPEGVFQEIKEEPRRKRVKKPLNQMSIAEKVNFLTSLPHNMPRALCLIEAEGKTYRGIVLEKNGEMVTIRTTGGGNPVELAIDQITSIHPLGF